MLHRIPGFKPLLFGLCSLLAASCNSRPTPIPSVSSDQGTDAPERVHERAAVYRERLRLGLGSPYRLIEIALRDDRLGNSRGAVARDLLAHVERGDMYEINPLALVANGVPEASAIAQVELIGQAIESAGDPRVGELAVNLAYELAAAEGTVTRVRVARVARIAALLRDRELARTDAQRLREAARRGAVAPENLVLVWRAERRFAVEQPTLLPLGDAAQNEAARLSLMLVGGIRSAVTPVASVMQRTVVRTQDGLASGIAAEVVRDSSKRAPQSALLITLRALRAGAKDQHAWVNAPHWLTFFEQATDEERFVAALALTRHGPADDVVAAAIALDAATALRTFAQEPIIPTATTAKELASRFGVVVRFDSAITAAERERSLHVLWHALTDLRSVIRSLDLAGLTFEIAPIDAGAAHLAFHEPRKRVIRLDPSTMAGTIAHELAHDLDWQLAARKYKTRSSYATDYATKNRRALARTVRGLVAAAPMNQPAEADRVATRPAEMFARRFEWYVASELALRGRSSGYLSSAQTDWIPGYGSAVRPDPAPVAAKSFASLVAEATSMDRTERTVVERTVTESAPIAVRVLLRAEAADDRSQFQRQTLDELREWECVSARQGGTGNKTAMRWFVDALSSAAFPPRVVSTSQTTPDEIVTLEPVKVVDQGNQLGLRLRRCNPLDGFLFAQSIR